MTDMRALAVEILTKIGVQEIHEGRVTLVILALLAWREAFTKQKRREVA